MQKDTIKTRWIRLVNLFKRGFFLAIIFYISILGGVFFLLFKIIQGFFSLLHG